MSDLEELELIKSFLAARDGSPSPESAVAMQSFHDVHAPLIRKIIKDCTRHRADDEDLFQEVWLTLTGNYRI